MADKLLGILKDSNTQNYVAFTKVSSQFILGRPCKLLFNYILSLVGHLQVNRENQRKTN